VLYVYRRVAEEAKIEYREMLAADAKARFGDLSLPPEPGAARSAPENLQRRSRQEAMAGI
jgi:hypothetical protein